MDVFASSLSWIILLHFTTIDDLCFLNHLDVHDTLNSQFCCIPFSLFTNCLLSAPPQTQLELLLEFYCWAAGPLSIHIAKLIIHPLLRFLLPPVHRDLPKYILILDFFLELQNLEPYCLFDIILKMPYGIANPTDPNLNS